MASLFWWNTVFDSSNMYYILIGNRLLGYVCNTSFGFRVSSFVQFLKIGIAILVLICKLHLYNKGKSIMLQVFSVYCFHIPFEWLSYFDIKDVLFSCCVCVLFVWCFFPLRFLGSFEYVLFILVCWLGLRSRV